jgi:hypothetical protein
LILLLLKNVIKGVVIMQLYSLANYPVLSYISLYPILYRIFCSLYRIFYKKFPPMTIAGLEEGIACAKSLAFAACSKDPQWPEQKFWKIPFLDIPNIVP